MSSIIEYIWSFISKNIVLLLGFLCLILFSILWYTNNKLDKISYDYYYIKSHLLLMIQIRSSILYPFPIVIKVSKAHFKFMAWQFAQDKLFAFHCAKRQ